MGPREKEIAQEPRKEEEKTWRAVGYEMLLAVFANNGEGIAKLGTKIVNLADDRGKLNDFVKALATVKDYKALEKIFIEKLGLDTSQATGVCQNVEHNFSSAAEFAAMFKGASGAQDFLTNFGIASSKIETYIWTTSALGAEKPIPLLAFGENERALGNFFVRKHFGMKKGEMEANFRTTGKDEVDILQTFTENLLTGNEIFDIDGRKRKFADIKNDFLKDYAAYKGGDVLVRLDLLNQRALLTEALPELERWGGGKDRAGWFFTDDAKDKGLLYYITRDSNGTPMSMQGLFALLSKRVKVDGSAEQPGIIRFLSDSEISPYTIDDLKHSLLPMLAMWTKLLEVRSPYARERAAFTGSSLDFAYAVMLAQGRTLESFIDGFLRDPQAMSVFAREVPELGQAGLKTISEQMIERIRGLLRQIQPVPQNIDMPFDMGIFRYLKRVEGTDTTDIEDVASSLMRLRMQFSRGSLNMLSDFNAANPVLLTPSLDQITKELLARPVRFKVNLPSIFTMFGFGGNADYTWESCQSAAGEKSHSYAASGIVSATWWGPSGGRFGATLTGTGSGAGDPVKASLQLLASNIVTESNELMFGEIYANTEKDFRASLEGYHRKRGGGEKESYLYSFFEKNENGDFVARNYLRDSNGRWYRLTYRATQDDLKRAFGVYFDSQLDLRAVFDNAAGKNGVKAFIAGVKLTSVQAAYIQGIRDPATMAKEYAAIVSTDTMGSVMGDGRAVSFIKAYSSKDEAEMRKKTEFSAGQRAKRTGSFWEVMGADDGTYGVEFGWKKKDFHIGGGYVKMVNDLRHLSDTTMAYANLRNSLTWFMGSYMQEVALDGAKKEEQTYVGSTEFKDGSRSIRVQASYHIPATLEQQVVSQYNTRMENDRKAITDAMHALTYWNTLTPEEAKGHLDAYRNAMEDLEKARSEFTVARMMFAQSYLGTLKVRVRKPGGEIGLEALGGQQSTMMNAYAFNNNDFGYQFVGSVGDVKGAGGKILIPVGEAAIAMVTGGVVTNSEFGTLFTMYGGLATRPSRREGKGVIIGARREEQKDAFVYDSKGEGKFANPRELNMAEAVFFTWKDMAATRIDGTKLASAKSNGYYVAVQAERSKYGTVDYYIDEMPRQDLEREAVRAGRTVISVEKGYAGISTFEAGGELAREKLTTMGGTENSEIGNMKSLIASTFIKWAKQRPSGNESLVLSLKYRNDTSSNSYATKPFSYKGSLLIFSLRGGITEPVYITLD